MGWVGSIRVVLSRVKESFGGSDLHFTVEGAVWIGFSLAVSSYRPNVALLLLDEQERLLICERMKVEGAWQFPQGGIDEGESAQEALLREVEEEIGLPPDSYEVIEFRGGYRYLFPPEMRRQECKRASFDGQEQTYFLCRLRKDAPPINVGQNAREFRSHMWIEPSLFDLNWLPAFKRPVYRSVLSDFFGVVLGSLS